MDSLTSFPSVNPDLLMEASSHQYMLHTLLSYDRKIRGREKNEWDVLNNLETANGTCFSSKQF